MATAANGDGLIPKDNSQIPIIINVDANGYPLEDSDAMSIFSPGFKTLVRTQRQAPDTTDLHYDTVTGADDASDLAPFLPTKLTNPSQISPGSFTSDDSGYRDPREFFNFRNSLPSGWSYFRNLVISAAAIATGVFLIQSEEFRNPKKLEVALNQPPKIIRQVDASRQLDYSLQSELPSIAEIEPAKPIVTTSISYSDFDKGALLIHNPASFKELARKRGMTGIFNLLYGNKESVKSAANKYATPEMHALYSMASGGGFPVFVKRGSLDDKNGDGINGDTFLTPEVAETLYEKLRVATTEEAVITKVQAQSSAVPAISIDDVVEYSGVYTTSIPGHAEMNNAIGRSERNFPLPGTSDYKTNQLASRLARNSYIRQVANEGAAISGVQILRNGKQRLTYSADEIAKIAREYSVSAKYAKQLVRKASRRNA